MPVPTEQGCCRRSLRDGEMLKTSRTDTTGEAEEMEQWWMLSEKLKRWSIAACMALAVLERGIEVLHGICPIFFAF